MFRLLLGPRHNQLISFDHDIAINSLGGGLP